MKHWTLLALIFCVGSAAWSSEGEEAREIVYDARVVRVFDGDTIWVQPLQGGRWRKLRLDGIDAPEICQPGGVAARDALAARVQQQAVRVRQRAQDDYGRAITVIEHRGDDVNRWLVSTGQAWAYRWRGRGPYVDEEGQARKAQRGLFAQREPENPRDFRRRHGPCAIPARPDSGVR